MPNSDKNAAVNLIEWDKLSDSSLNKFLNAKQRLINMGFKADDLFLDDIVEGAKKQIAIKAGEGNLPPKKDE